MNICRTKKSKIEGSYCRFGCELRDNCKELIEYAKKKD